MWVSCPSNTRSASVARTAEIAKAPRQEGMERDVSAPRSWNGPSASPYYTPKRRGGPKIKPHALPQSAWAFLGPKERSALCLLGHCYPRPRPRWPDRCLLMQADWRVCANIPASLDNNKSSQQPWRSERVLSPSYIQEHWLEVEGTRMVNTTGVTHSGFSCYIPAWPVVSQSDCNSITINVGKHFWNQDNLVKTTILAERTFAHCWWWFERTGLPSQTT